METPNLGIFWIVGDNEIVGFSVPLDRAEHAGGYANYPHGHVQMWPLVLRSHPRLRGETYDEVPRGRVTYDDGAKKFRLLLPPQSCSDVQLVERLVAHYGLPSDRTLVTTDEHYGRLYDDDGGD